MSVTTSRALEAVESAASERGLPVGAMRVLRDRTNVLVHLAPAPVVARVPITLARLRPPEWFRQEVRLARFLADAGAPVASPAEDLPPTESGRMLVTFWRYIDHAPGRLEPDLVGRSLRELHEALAAYEEPLPAFDRLAEVRELLALLSPSAVASESDLAALRAAAGRLGPSRPDEWRPIHGDSHFNNVLWSPDGPLWTDLENACQGPVEYDLACMLWRAVPGTDRAVVAYGAYDAELAASLEPYLAVFLAAWAIAVAERNPTPELRAEVQRRIERAAEEP